VPLSASMRPEAVRQPRPEVRRSVRVGRLVPRSSAGFLALTARGPPTDVSEANCCLENQIGSHTMGRCGASRGGSGVRYSCSDASGVEAAPDQAWRSQRLEHLCIGRGRSGGRRRGRRPTGDDDDNDRPRTYARSGAGARRPGTGAGAEADVAAGRTTAGARPACRPAAQPEVGTRVCSPRAASPAQPSICSRPGAHTQSEDSTRGRPNEAACQRAAVDGRRSPNSGDS